MLSLVLALALTQAPDTSPRLGVCVGGGCGNPPAISILEAGAGYSPTDKTLSTATGEPVPTTRASVHTCTQPDGTIEDLAVNEPCVSGGALAARASITNLLTYSEALDGAGWGDANSAPTVTADSWSFGHGTTGETLEDVNVASSSGRQQAYATTTAGSYTFACYMQSGTLTTARFNVMVVGGSGTAACGISALSPTTERKSCTVTAGAGVTSITPQVLVGATASDTGSIKVGGCQLTATSTLQDYCPTEGTAATCEGEVTTVDASALDPDEGCACVTVTPSFTGARSGNTVFLYQALDQRLGYTFSADQWRAYDGTTVASVSANYEVGAARRYCTRWSAADSYLRVENVSDGLSASQTFAGFPASWSTLYIGTDTGSGAEARSTLTDIVLDTDPEGCR